MTDHSPVSLETADGIGIIVIDSPSVNALGRAVGQGLLDAMASATADDDIAVVMILGAGRGFQPVPISASSARRPASRLCPT